MVGGHSALNVPVVQAACVIPSGRTLDKFPMHVRRDLIFRQRKSVDTYLINGAGELESWRVDIRTKLRPEGLLPRKNVSSTVPVLAEQNAAAGALKPLRNYSLAPRTSRSA